MGDADNDIIEAAPEIEALMDEALAVDGLVNFLTLVTELNERTKGILLELKILESFRKIFIALNFFIVPVVIAIMVCYGTRESVSKNTSGIQAGLQMAVMFLMFLSSSIGLPLYIISLWESYWISQNFNEELNSQSLVSDSTQINDSLLTLLTNESSSERLHVFDHLLNDEMQQRIRAHLLRRRNAEVNSSEPVIFARMENSSETEMESAVTDTTSAETNEAEQDEYSHNSEGKQKKTEFPILYQFQVLMKEKSPDLAVRFEPANTDEKKETTEDRKTVDESVKDSTESQENSPSIAYNNEEKDVSISAVAPEIPAY